MAPASDIKLLVTWTSPFSDRVKIALSLKSVDYELIKEDIFNKSDLLLESNPIHKKVPVLIHGDKVLCESLIIVEYVDELWKDALLLLPSDPYARAVARFWGNYIDTKWYPLLCVFTVIAEGEEELAAAKDALVEGLLPLEQAFVKCSKGKAFFGGDSIGYIDIALGSFLGWVKIAEKWSNLKVFDQTMVPNLAVWANNFLGHDALKGVVDEPEKFLEMARNLQVKFRPPKC